MHSDRRCIQNSRNLVFKSHLVQVRSSPECKASPNSTREEIIDGSIKNFAKNFEAHKVSLEKKVWSIFALKAMLQLVVLYLFSCRIALMRLNSGAIYRNEK
ncbi:MAG: hypothetical protein JWM78_3459 [Verrucomicrobiaceae bacterium]|nr:hypothetical protein [Verrucomicrobiaceae bacterium]